VHTKSAAYYPNNPLKLIASNPGPLLLFNKAFRRVAC
jgi:hypothetical protein